MRRPILNLLRIVIAFFTFACLARSAGAAPGDNVAVGPRPSWVDVAPDTRPGKGPPRPSAIGNVYDEISDEQIHVRPRGEGGHSARIYTTARYVRTRTHIVTGSGVERASELRFSFDPSYERLVFHSIRIIRDGVARDALDLPQIRVFSEESGADERIYDGTMTALAVLPDVRVGDVIDSEVTTEGQNPVFGGRFAEAFTLGSNVWTSWLRVRVLLPIAREIETTIPGSDLRVSARELGKERGDAERQEKASAHGFHVHFLRTTRTSPITAALPTISHSARAYPEAGLLRESSSMRRLTGCVIGP